jgi:cardiolipin synthase
MSIQYLPNIISIFRLFLVIPFIYYFIHAKFQISFNIFLIAAFTDALDGWIARKFNCHTNFGLIIDPVADKILIVSCIILLGYHHILPIWLVLLILGRDLAITFGAGLSIFVYKQASPLNPSLISKLNTVLQMILILSCLCHISYFPIPQTYLDLLIAMVTLTTIISFFHYLKIWYHKIK